MDVIAAPITPVVTSAVIVVRVSGVNVDFLFSLFTLTDKDIEPRKVYFTKYTGTELSDDVLFTYFKAPHSYTGEDVIEVSFHGNPIIVSSFLKELYNLGVKPALPGEFTKRAFLNGKIDLVQSEAVAELINAKSKYSIQYSYNLLSGGLKSLIKPIIDQLIDIGSTVEAFIEFPEEDLNTDELASVFQSVENISFSINKLVNAYRIANSYRTGFSVVIVGKPNVGKSSLLNFLLSHERSIVSEMPGTTRDYITEYADLDGIPIKLIDTAGIRISEDPVEQAGISRSLELIEKADLVIALFEASSFDEEDRYLLNLVSNKNKVIFVNKSDLNCSIPVTSDLSFSLKYQKDTEKIIPFLKSKLMPADAESASLELMINVRHRQLFIAILDHLLSLKSALSSQDFDIATFHIGEALGLLQEITGDRYTEDILDNIFEKFCIGK